MDAHISATNQMLIVQPICTLIGKTQGKESPLKQLTAAHKTFCCERSLEGNMDEHFCIFLSSFDVLLVRGHRFQRFELNFSCYPRFLPPPVEVMTSRREKKINNR